MAEPAFHPLTPERFGDLEGPEFNQSQWQS